MKLGVNIDHIATLRQARGGSEPNPVKAAEICLALGADYIVMHLRSDRRHIQETDLKNLAKTNKEKIHLEMAVTKEMITIAKEVKCGSVCFVPEFPNELTTTGGLNLSKRNVLSITRAVKELKKAGIKVSLFIDPNPQSIRTAKRIGADIVELCTKNYSEAKTESASLAELDKIQMATILAKELGLEVHSGHGLNYENVRSIAQINGMEALNIGHAIIAKAVFVGLPQAILDMKLLIGEK